MIDDDVLYVGVGLVFVLWGTLWAPHRLQRLGDRLVERGRSPDRLRRSQEGRGAIRLIRLGITILGVILIIVGVINFF
jgi:hypothetical protein